MVKQVRYIYVYDFKQFFLHQHLGAMILEEEKGHIEGPCHIENLGR
jgi:hypothetical protein